jgi:REP element-mobilizing transposase RayT
MAQTLFCGYFHIVFSTKNRFGFIHPEIEEELYAYIGGIVGNYKGKLISAGGTSNHIHLLASTNKNQLIPDLIGHIKRDSSSWIKTKGRIFSKFGWQDGYSAFSVGYTQLPAIKRYIAGQKEHHKKRLFEEEMRGFYRRYAVEYDERYVWD